ncbi:monovalent cation/H+ antiporter subunit D [Amaricoccus solimangrovi]|uniref:Monovalent cation/H+ antiporter subunit D n=1 Tax=Amaricoccus solimangrovi TaxID=2589815 RepID=A0A501WKF6_9RHOB|nr:monovalent cation/H+ antiporter subunit D [Amaricoccus solimangrovi]TPE49252.1 monovalent cation/H+ antiporter subunit D [Amaricoccus solimangrovi]
MPAPEHLIIAPVLIPLIAGALMLFYEDRQRRAKRVISFIAVAALVVVAHDLLNLARRGGEAGTVGVYLLGNWPPPFAIVLVLDRLAAMMLLLTAVLGLGALIFASARWDRRGQHFHSLFMFILTGLNGAFLTGDLFNLFVFFEVMLAASYGLALHGSGALRVRASLHYIAINLAASLLFLIGVSLIYGVTGTLNMADLAAQIPTLPAEQKPLLKAAAAILGIAFLVKAAMWPLCFWLPITYLAAAPPVAAMFAMLSKVGVYVILRMTSLFGTGVGETGIGAEILVAGGFATVAFGTFGVLASQGLGRLAGSTVLVSSGTLLAVIGLFGLGGGSHLVAAGLYYLVSSTLAISALFLIIELVERDEGSFATVFAVTAELYGFSEDAADEDEPLVGPVLPGVFTVLSVCYACVALLIAGLPPLAGFMAKFAILSAAFNPEGIGTDGPPSPLAFALTGLLLVSGLAAMIALVRTGIQTFWGPVDEEDRTRAALVELVPVIGLIAITLYMTVQANSVMRYMEATARSLSEPHLYVETVLGARPYVIEETAPVDAGGEGEAR